MPDTGSTPGLFSKKVAVVTGANKGIGFAIVRGLCKRFQGDVYLTSRDENRGKAAVDSLRVENLIPRYHQLDITDKESIEKFRDHIVEQYGGIDVLINNAAIAFKQNAKEPVAVQAEETLRVNYFALVDVCDILFPVMKNGGRVINIASSAGHLTNIPSENLRKKFLDPNLTVENLSELMKQYVEAAKQGTQAPEWGNSSYAVSKVGVIALTRIQQKMLANRKIIVNAVHPGWVATDMSSHKGPLTIEQGAAAPLYLALDAPEDLCGQFIWYNMKVVNWDGEKASEIY